MPRAITAVVALAVVLGLAQAGSAVAQEAPGQSLSLTLSERVEATRNLALDPGGSATTLQSLTSASLAYASTTPTSNFSVGSAFSLRAADGPGTDGTEFTLSDPNLRLGYGRIVPTSQFGLTASLARADVAFLRPLSDFIDGEQVLLPDDFDDLTGTGTRSILSLGTRLSIRDDAPFGLSFSAGLTDLSYQDVTDPGLEDSTRVQAGVQARFDLTEATRATLGLSYSGVETGSGETTETFGLQPGLSFGQPGGSYGLSLSLRENDGGTLIGFQLSREIEGPGRSLGASFGVSQADDTGAVLTGALTYSLERPAGAITARLDRDVSIEDGDASTVQTALALSASQALTPDLTGSLRAGLARSEETNGARTDLADLGASLGYSLTPDWSLSAGASYTLRDDSATGSADAQSLSLTLTRRFGARD